MGKSRLFTIFMVVFIGLMGFGFFIPLLPAFAAEFGANEAVQGVLIASYAAAQLIGAPILGRLSDRYGRRPVLLVSVLGTFLSLLMIGFANSLIMLFASRILDGLTGGNISVAQAYITDITDEKNRSRGLGLVGAAFGLGFIIGPALGGLLSMFGTNVVNPAVVDSQIAFLRDTNWTYALPAFGASLIGFINLIQVIFTLPNRSRQKDAPRFASVVRPNMAHALVSPPCLKRSNVPL
jgi:DHA1 family tetracycline resistance protein-like MFS transporter